MPSSEPRRAIEALRAGVPNRAAIRALRSGEQELCRRFEDNLRGSAINPDLIVQGQIVAGGFGAGKSHLLGYLRELALSQDFVVSVVTVSKETPLFSPEKLFVAAVRAAVAPRSTDDLMKAVMGRLKPGSDAFDRLEHWASSRKADLSPIFPALLHLLPKQVATPERIEMIGRFLAGGKLNTVLIKQWLREAGAHKLFTLKPVKAADLARQRIKFMPHMLRAAGYGGWCVLLDEVELVGKYSVMQRGRSYAELARWLGHAGDLSVPGIVAVAAITDDFKDAVIVAKRDDEIAPARLAVKGEHDAARLVQIGIQQFLLPGGTHHLAAPSENMLKANLEKVRALYRDAYGWEPSAQGVGEITAAKAMRQYTKAWITSWDIERIYGRPAEIETGTINPDYGENAEMERAGDDEDDEVSA